MGRCVEISIKIDRLVQHLDIASLGRSPADKRQQATGIGLQHVPVLINAVENDCRDRKHQPRRIETAFRQNMMDDVTMQASISVLKRMDIDEAESKGGPG